VASVAFGGKATDGGTAVAHLGREAFDLAADDIRLGDGDPEVFGERLVLDEVALQFGIGRRRGGRCYRH
jgi:hypothetical protein